METKNEALELRAKLWDSEWVNIVNNPLVIDPYISVDDAVAEAVKLTEAAMHAHAAAAVAAKDAEIARLRQRIADNVRISTHAFEHLEQAFEKSEATLIAQAAQIKVLRDAATTGLMALETCDAAHISDGGQQWFNEKLVEPAIVVLQSALGNGEVETCQYCEKKYPGCNSEFSAESACVFHGEVEAPQVAVQPLTLEQMFAAQHKFLLWNREQDKPPITVSVEYFVFENAIRIAGVHPTKEANHG